MLQHEVLVRELLSVDALAPGPVVVREVAALAHESGYDPVEGRAGETESLLACVFFPFVRSFRYVGVVMLRADGAGRVRR